MYVNMFIAHFSVVYVLFQLNLGEKMVMTWWQWLGKSWHKGMDDGRFREKIVFNVFFIFMVYVREGIGECNNLKMISERRFG